MSEEKIDIKVFIGLTGKMFREINELCEEEGITWPDWIVNACAEKLESSSALPWHSSVVVLNPTENTSKPKKLNAVDLDSKARHSKDWTTEVREVVTWLRVRYSVSQETITYYLRVSSSTLTKWKAEINEDELEKIFNSLKLDFYGVAKSMRLGSSDALNKLKDLISLYLKIRKGSQQLKLVLDNLRKEKESESAEAARNGKSS